MTPSPGLAFVSKSVAGIGLGFWISASVFKLALIALAGLGVDALIPLLIGFIPSWLAIISLSCGCRSAKRSWLLLTGLGLALAAIASRLPATIELRQGLS